MMLIGHEIRRDQLEPGVHSGAGYNPELPGTSYVAVLEQPPSA